MISCTTQPSGQLCAPTTTYKNCKPWDITAQSKLNCYADSLINETLSIAGATVNIHKLLGVYEQTRLLDLIGNGAAISGGDAPNYPRSNAFTTQRTEWQSRQTGSAAITASAYVGYDFGIKKLPTGREQYGVPVNVYEHITTIRIKQSSNPNKRALSARVERSNDGSQWFGAAIIQLPNDDLLNTINFKHSAPNRFWRIRPLTFVGSSCDSWAISAIEMHDHSVVSQSNIQDHILLENRDRDYQRQSVAIKGYYDLNSGSTEMTMFGQSIASIQYLIKINFNACVSLINRPLIVGDIVELPSETQYDVNLAPVKRYLEVSDVTWDNSSYTPGWQPLMLLVTAIPALATQETRDIFGDIAKHQDLSGLYDIGDGNNTKYQDFSAVDETIRVTAENQVPERGSEGSNTIREFTDVELAAAAPKFPAVQNLGFNRMGLYVEDAMPQNNAPFTRGPEYPASPKDGDYHRMEYVGLAQDVPARLYRYSAIKTRWMYLETDKRAEFNSQKATLTEYIKSPTKISARDVK